MKQNKFSKLTPSNTFQHHSSDSLKKADKSESNESGIADKNNANQENRLLAPNYLDSGRKTMTDSNTQTEKIELNKS